DAPGALHVDADVIGAGVGGRRASLARVHPHTDAHRRAVRERRRGESALRGRGRPDGFRCDWKDDEECVALDAHLEPTFFESVAQDARVRFEYVLVPVRAKLALELGRALDIGEKECEGAGRQPPPLAHPLVILLLRELAKTEASL